MKVYERQHRMQNLMHPDATGALHTHLYRLSSVIAKAMRAPSSRIMDTHIVTGVSRTKNSCQAISKYQPACQPYPADQ